MKSNISTVINIAEVAGRFPNESDLATIQSHLEGAAARLEAAEKLATYHDALMRDAGDTVFQRHANLQNPGGGADTQEKVQKCYRDIDYYLRLIHYCLIAGNTSPLDEWGLAGARELYRSLRLPTVPYVTALEYIRDRAYAGLKLSPAALSELRFYLDYFINAMS
ncbi:MAG: bleomycin hydrolase [Cyanobacteria bacterium SID2]|nr:bleomycin hydrolase [Cyanobacteria bacterium SID2]